MSNEITAEEALEQEEQAQEHIDEPVIVNDYTPPPIPKTDDEILLELARCKNNIVYWINTYVKIDGNTPFKMYGFQNSTIQEFIDNRFNVVLKSRQMGISWLCAAYASWMILFYEDTLVGILANKEKTAKATLGRIKKVLKYLPDWMRSSLKCNVRDFTKNNDLSIELLNGGAVMASATTEDALRGETLSLLIVDEAAMIPGFEETWNSIGPTLVVKGRAVVLSCVTKDTFVFTSNGIQQVEDFINPSSDNNGEDYVTKPYEIHGFQKKRSGFLFHNNGKTKTLKIATKYGEIEGAEKHKLWSCKDGVYDWYRLDELRVGDWVSMEFGMECWGSNDDTSNFCPDLSSNKHRNVFSPKKITPNIAYFLGLYISEGCSKLKKDFAHTTISCGDDISWVFNEIGLKYCTKDNLHWEVSSKTLGQFLSYLGFDLTGKAHSKKIPKRLMQMSRENIRQLVRGIMDGDGCSRSDRGAVKYASTSKILISQLRAILCNFGMRAGVALTTKEQMNSYNGKIHHNHDTWNLELNALESMKYYAEIGFGLDRKQSNQKILQKCNFERAVSFDVIPYSLDIVRELYDLSELNTRGLPDNGLNINGVVNAKRRYKTEHISKRNIVKLYELTKQCLSPNRIEALDRIVGDKITWVRIKSIEDRNDFTYDFSLPDDESDFWAHSVNYNGFIGHQTPKGVGNFYHRMYSDAEGGLNDFNAICLGWEKHPRRNTAWAIKQIKAHGEKYFKQEFACQFLGSGETLISANWIQYIEENWISAPIYKGEKEDKGFWYWELPKEGHVYIAAADLASGNDDISEGEGAEKTKTDFNACVVYDVTSTDKDGKVILEQVAEYYGKLTTPKFAEVLLDIGIAYNNALVAWENNSGWSQIVEDKFSQKQYYNVYRQPKNIERRGYNVYDMQNKTGFNTNTSTRNAVVKNLETMVTTKECRIRSKRFINEIRTFEYDAKKKRYEASKGSHDDLVMAGGICLYISMEYLSHRDPTFANLSLEAIKNAGSGKYGRGYDSAMPSMYVSDLEKYGAKPEDAFTDNSTGENYASFVREFARKTPPKEEVQPQRSIFEYPIFNTENI